VTRAWSCWNKFCARLTQLGALPGNPMDAVGPAKEPRSAPHALTEADPRRLPAGNTGCCGWPGWTGVADGGD
jgi:site-specific recombinase XerC